MSDKKNAANAAETQKVVTKYDRKMQKRREEAARAKKEERQGVIIGSLLVIALAAFVLSFPIRSYLAVNGEYIKVGGKKVTQVEFDMQYNVTKSTYIEQMGYYLSMFGMTDMSTLEYQQYSDNMTFGDYFAQMTAEGIAEQRGIEAKAEAAGFTFDGSEELEEMKADLEEAAKEAGVTFDAYVQGVYGQLATWNRIKPYLERSLYTSAYYNQVMEENMPSEEELQAEYEANKNTYDSVDYRMTVVQAELPTAAPDGTVEKDEEGNEIPYEPTEEEVAAAMKEAYAKAQEAEKTAAQDGQEYIGMTLDTVGTNLFDFLSDENRKAGDTTIIELESTNRYWAVAFEKRYLNQEPTHNVRMIYTSGDPQAILDEWKDAEATEDSFAALAEKYDEAGMTSAGGYYSGLAASDMEAEIEGWLTAERTAGDTFAVKTESGTGYVLYYLEGNEPVWKLNATSKLVNADMTAFMEEATADIEIEDRKKNLVYLHVEEESSEETSSEDGSPEEASEETDAAASSDESK